MEAVEKKSAQDVSTPSVAVKLDLKERLLLLNSVDAAGDWSGLIPGRGDFATMRLVDEVQQMAEITEDEKKRFNIRATPGGGMAWDGSSDMEITISPQAFMLLSDRLRKMDEAGKLTKQLMSLYEKFVLPGKNDR